MKLAFVACLLISIALSNVCRAEEGALEPAYLSAEERANYDSLASAYSDIVASHFAASPPSIEGLVDSEAPSLVDKLDLLNDSLWEETTYRASNSLRKLLPISPQGEFDGDWGTVADPLDEPYRAICRLELRTSNGRSSVGTGFLVGPQLVMTCKENVRDHEEIVVIPGANGAERPFGSAVAVGGKYYEAPEGTAKYDIAWIYLPDRRLYNRVGYTFGLRALEDADLEALNASVAGYSGTRMKVDAEKKGIKQTAPLQFYHDLDTGKGTRGAPVFSTKKRFAVGIQVLEAGDQVPHNQACRLTQDRIRTTKELIREGGR